MDAEDVRGLNMDHVPRIAQEGDALETLACETGTQGDSIPSVDGRPHGTDVPLYPSPPASLHAGKEQVTLSPRRSARQLPNRPPTGRLWQLVF